MLPDHPAPKTERTCPKCGLVFASDKLDGLCPACLLANTLDTEDPDSGPAFWEDAPGAKPMPARTFSHFELLDELGRGGMGVVYRARDLNTERIVALKVLQAQHLEVPDLVLRFRSEVRAVSSLDHPHVLPIHEVGEHDGIPFFSMKLTTGGSLASCIGNYLGRPRDAAGLLAKVALGVQHAHQRGILHRDLKPGNILLDAAGEPYVCDFGLAKWLEDDRKLTVTAAVLGTPHYIAPEQARGTKALTTAVDIYSLGAILYELLTGRPPFVGGTVLETLVASQDKTPDRPSSIAKNVPRDLETICLKALQQDPNARYATAGAFADDLASYLAGRPIQARPVGAAGQLWRWAKRNPLPASLVAALVLALATLAIGSTMAAVRIETGRKRAVKAEADAHERLYQSLVAQARASRLTGVAGQRIDSIEAVRQAAQMRPSVELRTEAIAALSLYDVRPVHRWSVRQNALKQPMRFGPDLTRLYVAQESGDVGILDTATGASLGSLAGIGKPIYALLVSPRGLVAARCEDDHVVVWDTAVGKKVADIPEMPLASNSTRWVYDLAFSPDGRRLAAAGRDGAIHLFDTATWRIVLTLHSDYQNRILCFSPDGRFLSSADMRRPSLDIFDLSAEGAPAAKITLPAPARSVAWNGDGKLIAVGCTDYNIYLIDAASRQFGATLQGHRQDVTQLVFSHKGALLASTSRDRTIRLWDVREPVEQVVVPGIGSEAVLAFSPDDQRLSASDYYNDAIVLAVEGGKRAAVRLSPPNASDYATLFSSLDFSPDGRWIASASFKGVALVSASNPRFLHWSTIDPGSEKSVRFLEGGASLLIASRARKPTVYTVEEGPDIRLTPGRVLEIDAGYILGSAATKDNGVLCFTSREHQAGLVYDLHADRILFSVKNRPGLWDMVGDAHLGWIATTYGERGADKTTIWDPARGSVVVELDSGAAGTLTVSPDCGTLLTTGTNGGLVWNTRTWKPQGAIQADTIRNDLRNVAYSPDGRILAVSTSRNIVLIDAKTGSQLAVLQSRPSAESEYRLRFSPSGDLLASQALDSSLTLWDVAYIREQLGRLNLAW